MRKLKLARISAAAVAATMMLTGIARGEVSVVLKKAVNICLECIGIG